MSYRLTCLTALLIGCANTASPARVPVRARVTSVKPKRRATTPTADLSPAEHHNDDMTLIDEPGERFADPGLPCPARMKFVPGGRFRPKLSLFDVEVGALCIDEMETTVTEYGACPATTCRQPGQKGKCVAAMSAPDAPVTCLLFSDAANYCLWRKKRLPTLYELAWATRSAGEETHYPPTVDPKLACIDRTAPCAVGSFPPSQFGLFDLVGNVAEWTLTTYTHEGKVQHITHGGKFDSKPQYLWLTMDEWGFEESVGAGIRCVAPP